MISKSELQEYAKQKDYNLGQAEKDYFQEIILFIIYREFGTDLVFKGGTALTKCYGFNRFSEDLDFTARNKVALLSTITEGLKKFYVQHTIEQKEYENSIQLICKIQGPLYVNQPNSMCRIEIDCSLREEILLKTKNKTIGLHVQEIPSFEVIVMSEEEILSEKVRAIVTRNKSRDLFDLYYLLLRKTPIDTELITKKLQFYGKKYSYKDFTEAIFLKKAIWDSELRHLVKTYPSFNEVFDLIEVHFNSL